MGYPMYEGKETINGKTVIITGANNGIGRETARELARRGGRIIMACRDTVKGEAVRDEIIKETSNKQVVLKKIDLASFASIRAFCDDINKTEPRVDILVNNSGVMMVPKSLTQDGIEMQLGVNSMGHFLLLNLLLDKIKASAPSRIIIMSSEAHKGVSINFDDLNSEKTYSEMGNYQQSKLANLLHELALKKRLQGTGVTVYGVHPGIVATDLLQTAVSKSEWIRGLADSPKTPLEGAQTTIMCAVSDKLANESGYYYSDCAHEDPSPQALDEAAAEKLWQISEKWTKCGAYA